MNITDEMVEAAYVAVYSHIKDGFEPMPFYGDWEDLLRDAIAAALEVSEPDNPWLGLSYEDALNLLTRAKEGRLVDTAMLIARLMHVKSTDIFNGGSK